MRAQRLGAIAGLRWIGEAFAIYRAAPLRQLVLDFAFLMLVTLALSVPLAGFALVWLLIPALMVGPHAVARAASRGATPGAALLLDGFRNNYPAQLRLGGFYLGGMALVILASVPADEGRFAQAMIGMGRLDFQSMQSAELQRAMLIVAGLQTLLLGILWYAPLLVAWQAVAPLKAAFFSAAAVLINWRAFLVYAVAMGLLFAMVLFVSLAAARLFGGGPAQQANAALFAVIWTLLPVWFASSFSSYRSVFDAHSSADGGPPESPTIPA